MASAKIERENKAQLDLPTGSVTVTWGAGKIDLSVVKQMTSTHADDGGQARATLDREQFEAVFDALVQAGLETFPGLPIMEALRSFKST